MDNPMNVDEIVRESLDVLHRATGIKPRIREGESNQLVSKDNLHLDIDGFARRCINPARKRFHKRLMKEASMLP